MTVVYLIRIKRMDSRLLKYPWEVGAWIAETSAYYGPASFSVTDLKEATLYVDVESADAAIDARAKGFAGVEFEIVPFGEVV